MDKHLYFGSNLKMYKSIKETVTYLKNLCALTANISRETMTLFILPSFLSLQDASNNIDDRLCHIGAQNMAWAKEGQYTGEVSPKMLQEIGINFAMVGHSERRNIFHETDLEENQKVKMGLSCGMTVLLCVGETKQQKELGVARETIRKQLLIGLHGLNEFNITGKLLIAYEPVWSIGAEGTPASSEYAELMHSEIKSCLEELFGSRGHAIPCLYGGSVNLVNASDLIVQRDIDGLYVGRSAWDADKFNDLIRRTISAYRKFIL